MAVYDINGNILAEMNQSNAKTYSLADELLSKVNGNVLSYAGYGPAITQAQATTRRTFVVTKGEMPYVDVVDGRKLNDIYPIPIPDDCTIATVSITPSTQYLYLSTRSYKDGKYSNTAVNTTGWQQGTASIEVVRNNGERMFLCVSSKYDSAGSSYLTEPTNVEITFSKSDIVSLNPDIKEKILQAKRPKNTPAPGGYLTNTQPVSLLWFSDIHADAVELGRIIKLRDKYSVLFDDAICTGDMVALRFSDGMDWWYNTSGSDGILMVIGNHDALAASSGYDWTNLKNESDQYDRYFAPNISKWGCVYNSGKTYYYKDYTNQKVRLIVLNVMLTGTDKTAQETWLADVLESARIAGLSVIVANHGPIEKADKIEGNFSSYDSGGTGASTSSYTALSEDYLSLIQNFIDAGGEFICHIAGHSHIDRFLRSKAYPSQYCVVLDALSRYYGNQYSDTQRTDNTKSQDLANVLVLDTSSKTVKIIRIGADMDHYCRQKHGMTFNYSTGEILAEY